MGNAHLKPGASAGAQLDARAVTASLEREWSMALRRLNARVELRQHHGHQPFVTYYTTAEAATILLWGANEAAWRAAMPQAVSGLRAHLADRVSAGIHEEAMTVGWVGWRAADAGR